MASRIQQTIYKQNSPIANIFLGSIPKSVNIEDLDLRVRTQNCLGAAGYSDCLDKLSNLTFGDIFRLRNFGVRSLLDLLMAIESIAPDSMIVQEPAGPGSLLDDRDWLVEANLLAETRYSDCVDLRDYRLGYLMREIDRVLVRRLELRYLQSLNAKNLSEILLQGKNRPTDPSKLASLLGELRLAIGLKASLSLREELGEFLLCAKSRRNQAIAARRLGWDGKGGGTLQEIGDEFGLTRERVRQLELKVANALRKKTFQDFAPILDYTLGLVAAIAPKSNDQISKVLMKEGIVSEPFDIRGLVNAAEMLNREVPFRLKTARKNLLAMPVGLSGDLIWKFAKSTIRIWGVSTVADIAAKVSEAGGEAVNPIGIRDCVRLIDGFEWLDEQRGWFWISDNSANPLINLIKKVLSISARIHIGELREGIRRPYLMKGFAPPRRVLVELCRRIPGCIIEGDEIIATPAPSRQEYLCRAEFIMAGILDRNGPLINRKDFEELCIAEGMTVASFWVQTSYSPIIARYAYSVYGLRGINITPGLAETLAQKLKRDRVLKDHGWTEDGRVWIGYKLSIATINNGMLSIPAALGEIVSGAFELLSEEGEKISVLIIQERIARGILEYFHRRGGEQGDLLLLEFNLKTRAVIARLGEDDLIERASSGELWQGD